TTMVNTGAGAKKESVVFSINKECYWSGDVANIKVEVEKNGERIELKAPTGKVPSKICVGVDYEWCSERQDIEEKYPAFKEWVKSFNGEFYK
ncbi:MAG: LruC domain-containing protein, partial [Prevotella sp.]|nr:LruC domain-containing protein [Prevotella sp.]